MTRYRSRVVEIDAQQLTSDNVEQVKEWITSNGGKALRLDSAGLVVETLEGPMEAPFGWWVIRGTEGEFYPCKASVFERKYDPA